MPMIDQEAAGGWDNTSTVVTDKTKANCPAPQQGNECKSCRACWDKSIKNIAYLAHWCLNTRNITRSLKRFESNSKRNKRTRPQGNKPLKRQFHISISKKPTSRQASQPQAKGSKLRPSLTREIISDPGYKRTFPLSGVQATRTKVFFTCLTWKDTWWGEKRILLTNVNFSSTVKKVPLGE